MKRWLTRSAAPVAALLSLVVPRLVPRAPAATTAQPTSRLPAAPAATARAAGTMARLAVRPPPERPGSRRPADPPFLVATARRPAAPPRPAIAGCSRQVDGTDPLAVAAAVAAWVYCGDGPPDGVSHHGRQVVLAWSAVELPFRPATVTSVALVDPRTAPVVAAAVVVRAADRVAHQVVLTLFRSSSGQWVVDDLRAVDN